MLIRLVVCAISVLAIGTTILHKAHAEETTTNKIKDTTDDAVTDAKKTARAEGRKIRQSTGTDNLGKDLKDKTNDVKDDVNNSVNKAKRDNQ
jgi:hypothetical protein